VKICSFLPSATEIAFALGLGDSVVGVTHECDFPPAAKSRRIVVKSAVDQDRCTSGEIDRVVAEHLRSGESVYTIDLEQLRAADPDIILTQELCDVCAVDYREVEGAARLLGGKPRIISLAPGTLSDVIRDIETVGAATGRSAEAREFTRRLKEQIERVRERAANSDLRPRVACIEWLDPLYSAGHWVPEMVEIAGGENGLGEKGRPSRRFDWEELVAFSPEVLVLMPCGFDVARTLQEIHLLERLPGWNQLAAVANRRIFVVDGHAYFNRSGPRLVDGLEILAQMIHPEMFPWVASEKAARKVP
jgi:iron complex transport system substrate-binding protein